MTDKAASITPSKFTVALGFLRPTFDYVRQQGKDLQPLLDVLGVTEADLNDPDKRVDDAASETLLDLAETLCDDPNIGLHVGQGMQATHLGVLGMLMMTCVTSRDAFELVTRYQALVGDGGSVKFFVENGEFVLSYQEAAERDHPYPRHCVESCLIGWASIARAIGGSRYSLSRATIACPPPADISEQEEAFGCPVEYNAATNSLRMPEDYADIELFSGNPGLKDLLETQAKQRLQSLQGNQIDADPVMAKTKQFIAEGLAYGVPTIDDVAVQFHASARTLQRQFEAAGKGYKELVDEVRADLAKKYMADKQLSLLDVALMLGFSEQSSFQRAFKRWFEQTPGQYRSGLNLGLS